MMTLRPAKTLLLIVLIFCAVGVWTFSFFAHTHASAHPSGGPPGRMRLEICVQNVDGTAVAPGVMDKITSAFKEVKKHRDFDAAGLNAGGGPVFKPGCSGEPTIRDNKAQKVTKPSPIFTFVFIASEEALSNVPFKHYPRVKSQETMCEGDVCAEVTKALYITPQEIENEEILVQALTFGVGLMPADRPRSQYVDGVTRDPEVPGR